MKRFLLAAVIGFGGMFLSPSESVAEEMDTMFYDFSDMLIDGEFLRPEGMQQTARGQARFESLLQLRRSFMSDIEVATQEESLK